eukprot:TRINITY_DN2407_c0_g1_i1.p1 TRINITY_DN2407_c0_g1~~TRINITY_DN2407_c0_g1_i1.p1  ORF type:complete len:797 (+),score=207.79 TRINITY_DN2407_c0_g1_i1:470-2860(+)
MDSSDFKSVCVEICGNEIDFENIPLNQRIIDRLFSARCEDLQIPVDESRKLRFYNVIASNCMGNIFCLRSLGLGTNSARVLTDILANPLFIRRYHMLDLFGNKLKDDGVIILAPFIRQSKIAAVDLRANEIGSKGYKYFFETIKGSSHLCFIDLSGHSGLNRNHLGRNGAVALSKFMEESPVLQYLNLDGNGISEEGSFALGSGIGNCPSLVSCNLTSNNLGMKGIQSFVNGLIQTKIELSLETLNLSRNRIGSSGLQILSQILPKLQSLKNLNLRSNDIKSSVSLNAFCRSFIKTNITTLDFSENILDNQSIFILTTVALLPRGKLEVLYLEDCQITDVHHMFSAFSESGCSLRKISLAKNLINNEGLESIAEFLGNKDCMLTYVNLMENRIGFESQDALINSLFKNKTLEYLNLRDNMFDNELVIGLLDVLEENPDTPLINVDVSLNHINHNLHEYLKQLLKIRISQIRSSMPELYRSRLNELKQRQEMLAEVRKSIESAIIQAENLEELVNEQEKAREQLIIKNQETKDQLEADVQSLIQVYEIISEQNNTLGKELSEIKANALSRREIQDTIIVSTKNKRLVNEREIRKTMKEIVRLENQSDPNLKKLTNSFEEEVDACSLAEDGLYSLKVEEYQLKKQLAQLLSEEFLMSPPEKCSNPLPIISKEFLPAKEVEKPLFSEIETSTTNIELDQLNSVESEVFENDEIITVRSARPKTLVDNFKSDMSRKVKSEVIPRNSTSNKTVTVKKLKKKPKSSLTSNSRSMGVRKVSSSVKTKSKPVRRKSTSSSSTTT